MSELTLAEQPKSERCSNYNEERLTAYINYHQCGSSSCDAMFFPTDKSIIIGLCLGYIALFIAQNTDYV